MSKDADIKQFVPSGTQLKCSNCDLVKGAPSPVSLAGGNLQTSIYGKAMMTNKDIIVGTNIVGVFNLCKANPLTICAPVITKPWEKNADPQITANKNELLVNDSFLFCDAFAGKITPIMDDPVDITVPKKDAEGKILPTIENPIDALKEKMNGAVVAVKNKLDELQKEFGTDLGELLNDVTKPIGTVLNRAGVQNAITGAQELVGKAQEYKNKADQITDAPNAAKEKISSEILGTEPEKKETVEDEDKNKSLQERINDGIGSISNEIEAYKQEVEDDDENFVVEGFSNILGSMNESLSEFRTHFTNTFKPSDNEKIKTETSPPEGKNNSISDKAKEEYDDVKEYREEYKEYRDEANTKYEKYAAKLKNAGYDVSGNKSDIVKAIMLLNFLEDKKEKPEAKNEITNSTTPKTFVADNKSKKEDPEEKAKKTTKKNPGTVRTTLNAEVTGYIDHKLLESGINEDVKEAKEDLAEVQKDINRAKKYLTIASNFNDSVKALKESVMGKIDAEIGEKFKKITDKQSYLANYMTMGSSALEVSKFALSGFATSPGSVITRVDDGRGEDTDDEPNSEDENKTNLDGLAAAAALGGGSDKPENDRNLEPKILRIYTIYAEDGEGYNADDIITTDSIPPDIPVYLVIQSNGKANGEEVDLDLQGRTFHYRRAGKDEDDTDRIIENIKLKGASPNFEKGESYDLSDPNYALDASGKRKGEALADKTRIAFISRFPVEEEGEEPI